MQLLAAPRLAETRRRPVSRTEAPPARTDALNQVLDLQRTAGNHAVTRLLQRSCGCGCGGACSSAKRSCGPGCACAQCRAAMLQRQAATSFLIPPSGPFEGAVSSDVYEKQPSALRRVVDASAKDGSIWWLRLDRDQRFAVASLYNRLQKLGIWSYVRRIKSVIPGTPPWCGFWVAGDTPTVKYEGDAAGLLTAMTGSSNICYDAGIGGMLHGGQSSFREVSTSDSLHVSVGKGRNDFDAHIDKHASPKAKKGIVCEYDPVRTMKHLGGEVLPGFAAKKRRLWGRTVFPGLGGFEVFPEDPAVGIRPDMFERTERGGPPPSLIGITWRFGRKR